MACQSDKQSNQKATKPHKCKTMSNSASAPVKVTNYTNSNKLFT